MMIPTGQDYDLHHWWQLTLNNTNWTNTINYVYDLAGDTRLSVAVLR